MKTIKMIALLLVIGMGKLAASAPAPSKLTTLRTWTEKQVGKAVQGLISAKDLMKQQVPSKETMSKFVLAQCNRVKNNPKKSIAIAVSAVYLMRTLYNVTRAPKESGNLANTHKSNSFFQRFIAAIPSPFQTNGTGILLL